MTPRMPDGALLMRLPSNLRPLPSNSALVAPLRKGAAATENILADLHQQLEEAFKHHAECLAVVPEAYTSLDVVQTRVRTLVNCLERLYRTDPLTYLGNRFAFSKWASTEFELRLRLSRKVAVVLLDIDFFKSINDRFGHDLGDDILRAVGRKLSRAARRIDYVGRHGGEEFLLALPNINSRAARVAVERFRAAVGQIMLPDGKPVTLSAGFAMFPLDSLDPYECIGYADAALYAAKNEGRNRIVGYSR